MNEKNVNTAKEYYSIGIKYCLLKRHGLALAYFEEALKLYPEYIEAQEARDTIIKTGTDKEA